MSLSERRLWRWLSDNQLGFRFRRQYPVGPYVLDFYCHEALLCVEVDGRQHEMRVAEDAARDAYLAGLGIFTLRIGSMDLLEQGYWVARGIQRMCVERSGRPAGGADMDAPYDPSWREGRARKAP